MRRIIAVSFMMAMSSTLANSADPVEPREPRRKPIVTTNHSAVHVRAKIPSTMMTWPDGAVQTLPRSGPEVDYLADVYYGNFCVHARLKSMNAFAYKEHHAEGWVETGDCKKRGRRLTVDTIKLVVGHKKGNGSVGAFKSKTCRKASYCSWSDRKYGITLDIACSGAKATLGARSASTATDYECVQR